MSRTHAERSHLLQSNAGTVHWGFLDGGLPPVLKIESGERVTIECVTGSPDRLPPASSGFVILPELKEIFSKAKRGTGAHILTGPIYVRDAQPGDVLEVRILDIQLRQDWGFNLFRASMGTIPEDFPYTRLIHVPLDRAKNVAIMPSGITIPLAPFFGQLAVAPPKAHGPQNSKEPGEFGGNIDCKDLLAGTTIYLPVLNEGALFSTGDGHGAQGHGEVDGTALETALKGTFEFHVRKDLGWKSPRAETPTHIIAFGFDPDLDAAAQQALKQLLDWIVSIAQIHKDEAYALCSIAADLCVTQTVNNVKGVHAMIKKDLLRVG